MKAILTYQTMIDGKAKEVTRLFDTNTATKICDVVEAKITIDTGYTWADLLASVQEKIDGYFLELAKSWENEQNITVRILRVNAAIASVEGIIDVQNTALNGREENLLLDPNAIPVRGVILCKQ